MRNFQELLWGIKEYLMMAEVGKGTLKYFKC